MCSTSISLYQAWSQYTLQSYAYHLLHKYLLRILFNYIKEKIIIRRGLTIEIDLRRHTHYVTLTLQAADYNNGQRSEGGAEGRHRC